MMSASRSPCDSASRGLIQAVGSHVILVSGFGSSCSQPLFAKRPSQMVGSGRKMISSPDPGWLPATGCPLPGGCGLLEAGSWEPEAAVVAVPGTQPSCSTCFQKLSLLLNGCPVGSVIVQLPA